MVYYTSYVIMYGFYQLYWSMLTTALTNSGTGWPNISNSFMKNFDWKRSLRFVESKNVMAMPWQPPRPTRPNLSNKSKLRVLWTLIWKIYSKNVSEEYRPLNPLLEMFQFRSRADQAEPIWQIRCFGILLLQLNLCTEN